MSVIKVETKVTGNVEAQVVFELDQAISLTGDGAGSKQSTDRINVADGILNMQFHAHAVRGTNWSLAINQIEPEARELFKKSGMTGKTGNSLIADAVFV